MTALRFMNNNDIHKDAYHDKDVDDDDDSDELRLQKQWLQLQRLLYCMERPAMTVSPNDDPHHADRYHWREILFRAEHCHALWQSLLQMDPQAQRLAQRVDQACRKAHEQVHQLRQQQQQQQQDQPVEEAGMDVIDHIFGGNHHQNEHQLQDNNNVGDNENLPDDDPYDGLLDEDDDQGGDQQHQSNQGGEEEEEEETHYNIQDFQKQQREQMEEAIALMAEQMKETTQGIQSQLQQQTSKTLTELETVAEQNVHDVAAVAQNVQQHNRRQQRRNWGTWTLLFTIVGVFVLCLATIFTIPKRPNTCLIFCQQESSMIGIWVIQPVKIVVVQPMMWFYQEYLGGGQEDELSKEKPGEVPEWEFLYDEDEIQRREKEKLDQLLQSLKSDPPKKPKVKATVDWREAMEDEVFGEEWEPVTDEIPVTKNRHEETNQNADTTDNDDDDDDQDDNDNDDEEEEEQEEGEDDDDGGDDDEEDDDDHNHPHVVQADKLSAADEEDDEDMIQDDSNEPQEGTATMPDAPDDDVTLGLMESLKDQQSNDATLNDHGTLPVVDSVNESLQEVESTQKQQHQTSQETQDGEQSKEAVDNVNQEIVDGTASDTEKMTIDTEKEDTRDTEALTNRDPGEALNIPPPHVDVPDHSVDDGTVTQEVLPNGEIGTDPHKLPETVHDVNMAALLASLKQAAQQTQQEDIIASEAMVSNNKRLPLGDTNSNKDEVPPGTAKPREGEARTRISPRDVRYVAEIGDVQRLQEYLSLQPDFVDRSDKNQWTPLHLAARSGHAEIIQLLYDHGASLSVENNRGNTPLMEAIVHLGNDHGTVKLLRQLNGEESDDGNNGSFSNQQEPDHDKLQAKRDAIRLAILETITENDPDLMTYVKEGRNQLEQMTPKQNTKAMALEQVDSAENLDEYVQSGRIRLDATL